jgi:hypothetical protein
MITGVGNKNGFTLCVFIIFGCIAVRLRINVTAKGRSEDQHHGKKQKLAAEGQLAPFRTSDAVLCNVCFCELKLPRLYAHA